MLTIHIKELKIGDSKVNICWPHLVTSKIDIGNLEFKHSRKFFIFYDSSRLSFTTFNLLSLKYLRFNSNSQNTDLVIGSRILLNFSVLSFYCENISRPSCRSYIIITWESFYKSCRFHILLNGLWHKRVFNHWALLNFTGIQSYTTRTAIACIYICCHKNLSNLLHVYFTIVKFDWIWAVAVLL